MSDDRFAVTAAARSRAGWLYRYGSMGPMYSDCSGLAQAALMHVEPFKSLPAFKIKVCANEMALKVFKGCEKNLADVQQGDLLFYGLSRQYIDHVMMCNWVYGPGIFTLIGARSGRSDTLTDQIAYQQGAMVDVVKGDYWLSMLQIVIDPWRLQI